MNKTMGRFLFAIMIVISLFFLLGAFASFAAAMSGNEALISVAFVCVFLFFMTIISYIVYYNKFVKYKNKVAESLSLIDVYLKKRFDLVPNLVESVKGYMKYEKELLNQVTSLRASYMNATQEKEKIKLSNKLAKSMKKVFITAEEYPELKASSLFKNFMFEITDLEDEIAAARRFYNSNVNAYNSAVETFPGNVIASAFGFEKQTLFKIDANQKVIGKLKF